MDWQDTSIRLTDMTGLSRGQAESRCGTSSISTRAEHRRQHRLRHLPQRKEKRASQTNLARPPRQERDSASISMSGQHHQRWKDWRCARQGCGTSTLASPDLFRTRHLALLSFHSPCTLFGSSRCRDHVTTRYYILTQYCPCPALLDRRRIESVGFVVVCRECGGKQAAWNSVGR